MLPHRRWHEEDWNLGLAYDLRGYGAKSSDRLHAEAMRPEGDEIRGVTLRVRRDSRRRTLGANCLASERYARPPARCLTDRRESVVDRARAIFVLHG